MPAETDDDDREYDRHQEHDWDSHAVAGRRPNRGEPQRRPSREESWDREREQHYDSPQSPRERTRNHPPDHGAREDQRDPYPDRARAASSRDWEEQWGEDTGRAEPDLPRERDRDPPRRAPDDDSEDVRRHGSDRQHGRHRPNPAPPRARDEDWRESPQRQSPDRENDLYGERTRPPRERSEDQSRPRKKGSSLPNRPRHEDRFEDSDASEGEDYRERYGNPPRLAPEREPENSSWEGFSEEDADRYVPERSPAADRDSEDAERSNFDHEPDRAPRRRHSLDDEQPFETIPRHQKSQGGRASRRYPPESDYQSESESSKEEALSARRAKVDRRPRNRQLADEWEERFHGEREEFAPRGGGGPPPRAGESENLPPQRTRLSSREEHRRRRDPRRQRLDSSDDEQWRPEQDTFSDDSFPAGDPHSEEGTALGGPYRDLGAAARRPPPPKGEQRRDVSPPATDPEGDRDAAVDKAIAEITRRQRMIEEEAAAEITARLRRAEVRAAQQPPAPVAPSEPVSRQTAPSRPPADINAGTGAPRDEPDAQFRPRDHLPPATVHAPTAPWANAAAAPAPQKVPNDALVAEITARMRALDSEPFGDRKTTQRPEESQTGAHVTAPQRSLLDDVADDILAEKNERDRSTAGERAFSLQPVLPEGSVEKRGAAADHGRKTAAPLMPSVDLGGLERQLRQLTARIDALRPTGELKNAIDELRRELLAIGKRFTEAVPQHALQSLDVEIKNLARRLDDSRDSGADSAALAGIERGLAEVREVLHGLTPAEALVGFGEAIAALTQKVDAIVARDDPAALEQLHIAISNLRHAVSRVASDDALSMVAEDVRLLSARIDDLAHSVNNHPLLAQIESRIDALTTAIHASTKSGQAAPRELEKLLSALVDKLELSQLTQTDQTALAHLEDRIAMLMQRLDASDARLGLLEGVERGLADLLVYIEQLRAGNGGADSAPGKFVPADAIEHQFAEIKDSERRTQDSIEAVQGTVEHVVDRLARIESDMRVHRTWGEPAELLGTQAPELAPELPRGEEPDAPLFDAPRNTSKDAEIEPADRRSGVRTPIDPNLPPDHPIEPGAAPGRTRRPASPTERLAALESGAAVKSPVIPDSPGGKADFIAAARRAAQAAASTAPNDKSSATPSTAPSGGRSKKVSDRLRTLFVAAAVVAIVVGGFRVVSQMLDHGGRSTQTHPAPPRVVTEPPQGAPLQLTPPPSVKEPPAHSGGASGANTTNMPKAAAIPASGAEPEQNPAAASAPAPAAGTGAAQSLLTTSGGFAVNSGTLPDISNSSASKNASPAWSAPDVTGSLPPSAASRNSTVPLAADKLPSAIGGPALRTAAAAGDAAAAYEVGVRFAEGRSVSQNNEEAVHWLEIAAKKGFVPAEFRLGTFYEKGVGVKKDLSEALKLYRAAADKGHGKAMHNLAVLYAEGATGAPDYRSAAQWFRKAAEMGVTDSQYNLAILYARGVGVEQSFAEAYKWFFLAAKQGDKDAAHKRDEVAAHLDQQALAAAKSAAEQWSAQPEPAEAVTVKASEAWDVAPKGTSAVKTKSHSVAKVPPPDVMKIE
jgi:localization factor PodJL